MDTPFQHARIRFFAGTFLLVLALSAAGAPLHDPPVLVIEQSMPATIDMGASFTIEIVVRNPGSGVVQDVEVIDTLPAGCGFVTATPSAEHSGDRLRWHLGQMRGGERQILRLVLERLPGEEWTTDNVAEATFRGSIRSTFTPQVRGSRLRVHAVTEETFFGQPASLSITVQNTGSTEMRDVILNTLLSEGLTHPQGNDLEASLGQMAPGESRTISLEIAATRQAPPRSN